MMIIKTSRSRVGSLVDFVLTALAWLVFGYLFLSGILSILAPTTTGIAVPFVSRLLPNVHALLVYVTVSLCIGLVLFLWASYNAWRFGGLERRKALPGLSDVALAKSFHLDLAQLKSLHASRRIVIHHTDDGEISLMALDDQKGGNPEPIIHLAS